ncbi:MAG: hypothetical protein V4724_02640 [Pseudomonadota bacterium]
MLKLLRKLVLAASLLAAAGAWAENVQVLVYHDFPPFVDAGGANLSRDVCALLDARATGRYKFLLQVVPRRRLDALLLRASAPVLVLWVSPDFFPEPQRYHWGGALMPDSAVLLTMPGRQIDPAQAATLRGLRFGALSGHYYNYPGIEAALKDGTIARLDDTSPERNYRKLLLGRIDMTIIAESTFYHLRDHVRVPGTAVPQQQQLPSSVYHRSYFTLGADPALQQFLHDELDTLRAVRGDQPGWRIQSLRAAN